MEQVLKRFKASRSKTTFEAENDGSVGTLIREWRTMRKLSQMDLALDADISPRHLSFVETGRSRPSAEVLMTIANHLDIPLRTRNTLLLAAGFAPRYSEQGLGSARMAQIKGAVQRLLDTHEPYPGVALDGQWNVVLLNKTAEKLMDLLPDHLKHPTINMFRVSLHPDGFARHTKNFHEWGSYLLQVLQRLRLTTRGQGLDELSCEVNGYPNVQAIKEYTSRPLSAESSLLVPCILDLHGHDVSLFTTLTIFGSPRTSRCTSSSSSCSTPQMRVLKNFLKKLFGNMILHHFHNQVKRLVALRYPELFGLDALAFRAALEPLAQYIPSVTSGPDVDNGNAPFILVINSPKAPVRTILPLVTRRGKSAVERLHPIQPEQFLPTGVGLPTGKRISYSTLIEVERLSKH
jgi:transcriptional regulator with XRE-family HTH domain